MTTTAVRLPPETLERLDALADRLSERASGATIKRSDVIRLAIERGAEALEAETKRKK